MSLISKRWLGLLAGCLLLLLLWGFMPWNNWVKAGLSILVVVTALVAWRHYTQQIYRWRSAVGQADLPFILPSATFHGKLVLVCGAEARQLFGKTHHRETPQNWYIRIDTPEKLVESIQAILQHRPELLIRLILMMTIAPECHRDEGVLRGQLRSWRRQIMQLRDLMQGIPPIVLCAYLHENALDDAIRDHSWQRPESAYANVLEPWTHADTWFTALTGQTDMAVWHHGQPGQALSSWISHHPHSQQNPRLSRAVELETLATWLQNTVMAEYHADEPGLPILPVHLCAIHFGVLQQVANNVWQQQLYRQTALVDSLRAEEETTIPHRPAQWANTAENHVSADAILTLRHPPATAQPLQNAPPLRRPLPFPDALLTLLAPRTGLTPYQRAAMATGTVLTTFAVCALLASYWNNHQLMRALASHLAIYHQATSQPPAPKLKAQEQLKADAALLESYQQQGIPWRLGLGLYTGMPIYPVLIEAINRWQPAPPPSAVHATQLKLDSLSLFEVGSAQLKADANKVLISALMEVKNHPRWLVLIAGHTDNTGNPAANQSLSLARAEAVRNWIQQNSDLPNACFAVQGYGDTQPMADNDSESGRAANRRVEIRLIPPSTGKEC